MDKKLKEGMSVQELENFGRKYLFEIFFAVYFLLATLLTFLFFGAAWSVSLSGIGGILGVWLPKQVSRAARAFFRFVFKQEEATKWILAAVGVVVSFFLPPLIFFFLGLMGGKGCHTSIPAATKPCSDDEGEDEERGTE